MKPLCIKLGAMSEPIEIQVKSHGLQIVNKKEIAICQKASESATFLGIHGLLSDSMVRDIERRIVNRVMKAVKP
jgi:hypothetical protein